MKNITLFVFVFLLISCSKSKKTNIEKIITPKAIVYTQKSNILYIGMDNYLTIITPYHTPNEIEVKASGGKIFKENDTYRCRVKNPGIVSISIIDKKNSVVLKEEKFRSKRIPTVTARLGRYDSGQLDIGTIKAQSGIAAWIDNFDIDARCKTVSYNTSLIRQNVPITKLTNKGAKFNGKVGEVLYSVEKGDILLFDEIKCLCPGDKAARKISPLIFWVD